MANSNGWGDGAGNNAIGWGQGANNNIGWGDSHAKSWAGLTNIVGIDTDAQAFITAAAITDPVQINAINTLVEGMKTDGIWTKMKAIYPFVGGTASTHKYNLKDPRDLDAAFRLVFNGGWTHSSNGATPNGTNGYADTKLNPVSSLSSGSKHLSFYSRTQNISGNRHDIGCEDSTTNRNFDLFLYFQVLSRKGFIDGNYPTNSAEINNTNTLGYQIGSRTSSSNQKLYFNNSLLVTNTIPLAVADPNFSLFIGATNTNNTATAYSNRQTAFATIGDGLNDTEAANLYTRVQAYQTALSRQV
jgi:hypothetical protein